jgi:predicted ATPase
MKVIGISGAQGGGKSTLLAALQKRGWALDQFRVSRAVQAQLGWESLDRVMDSPDTMIAFQEEVFAQKHKNDSALMESTSKDIVLTERTFADICAYTTHWTWKFVDQKRLSFEDAKAFILPYTLKCSAMQNLIYSGTVLLPYMVNVPWQEDPNRAAKADADTIYENVERFLDTRTPVTHRRFTISAESVEARANQVEQFLERIKDGATPWRDA